MKQLVFTYCEGNDTKIAVVQKEKDKIKILKAASFDVVAPAFNVEDDMSGLKIDGDGLNIEGMGKNNAQDKTSGLSNINIINSSLRGINLSKAFFVPVLTEPSVHYHVFEGTGKHKTGNFTQEIIDDIQQSKSVVIKQENLEYVELADKAWMAVFLSGEVSCIRLINSLAQFNGKRNYKIQAVKSAELSLAYYIAKRKKFFPDDYSLIVYIGKEYSKLIFLRGRKLKHIGTTLDIGTLNLHTYDVYFSKILLEMENGGISSLDNIIVCGEDDSENLILSFYGTFPEANVSRIEFGDIDLGGLTQGEKDKFSSYSVPIAVATEYFDELENVHKGINLLQKYVKEDQKLFQFGWHGYAMLPVLFGAAFFITLYILGNQKEINQLDNQITEQTILMRQNQETLTKIADLETKISGFDQTQAILDSAAVGTGVWQEILKHVSNFAGSRKNMWLTKISYGDENVVIIEGYALSRRVLSEFAYSIESATLKSVNYEALREKNTYKFVVTFDLSNY